jgi:4-diphosphocytidyl-2-C-methyl-D-erythritol kinase
LIACDALWDTGLGRPELSILAARVGSDVPFGLVGGTALGTGRGERLVPAMVGGTFHWVLAIAEHGLPTAEVYLKLDALRDPPEVVSPAVAPDVLAALRAADATALGSLLTNDLQPAACARPARSSSATRSTVST